MIFFTKLKKLKKSNNRRFFPSFTLIELLIIIIIIGIVITSISFNLNPAKLDLAADNLIKNIRYTQSLALKDDKYQPFPLADNEVEYNRSKYWFKQWWQIRFAKRKSTDELYYEIFSDLPYNGSYNFSKNGYQPTNKKSWEETYAKNPINGLYLIGIKDDGSGNYPQNADTTLNLTKYCNIKRIEVNGDEVKWNVSKRFLFDNYGNIFTTEGKKGDGGDINPLDKDERKVLRTTAIIRLCKDNPCKYEDGKCIQINITPTGEVYKSKCK
jgi:type II secretory pathway pseudopilin PulG